MFTVRHPNFGNAHKGSFATESEAIAVARSHGFEASISRNGVPVGIWSPIGGFRRSERWAEMLEDAATDMID